jgi:hypothetical protein
MIPEMRQRGRRVPYAKRLAHFEGRLARQSLRPVDRRIVTLARRLAGRRGRLDLRALAARAGRPVQVIYRRRAWLAGRGLWPWETDKSGVGVRRRPVAPRRRVRTDPGPSPAPSPAPASRSLHDACRDYLEEFRHIQAPSRQ